MAGFIEVIAVVCATVPPGNCKDVHLTFSAQEISPFTCFLYGQVELAKWKRRHPSWRIVGWKCGRAGLMAKA